MDPFDNNKDEKASDNDGGKFKAIREISQFGSLPPPVIAILGNRFRRMARKHSKNNTKDANCLFHAILELIPCPKYPQAERYQETEDDDDRMSMVREFRKYLPFKVNNKNYFSAYGAKPEHDTRIFTDGGVENFNMDLLKSHFKATGDKGWLEDVLFITNLFNVNIVIFVYAQSESIMSG